MADPRRGHFEGRGGDFEDRRGRGGRGHGRGGRGGGHPDWEGRGGGYQPGGGRGGGFQRGEDRGGGFQRGGGRGGGFQRGEGRGGGFQRGGGRGGGFQTRGDRGGHRGWERSSTVIEDQGGRDSDFRSDRRRQREPEPDFPLPSLSPLSIETGARDAPIGPGDLPAQRISGKGDVVSEPPSASASQAGEEGHSTGGRKKKSKKARQGELDQSSSSSCPKESQAFPVRPNVGESGQRVLVEVNCWDFELSDREVLVYDLTPKKLKCADGKELTTDEKRLKKFVKEVVGKLGDGVFHDGGKIVYSLSPLFGDKTETSDTVAVTDPQGKDDLVLEYNIKKVSSVSAHWIKEYIESRRTIKEIPQDCINMVDNAFKQIIGQGPSVFFKSGIYSTTPWQSKTNGLFHIHRGFSLSVRPQWKCRLNVDLVYRAFFPPGNLAEILYEKFRDTMYDKSTWDRMKAQILSLRVEASHYSHEGKPYKKSFVVHGLSPRGADAETVGDTKQTIAQYFKEKYSITLQYPELPCIKTKKDKDEFIPMELLHVMPFQNSREDPGVIARDVIRCAAVPPSERFKTLNTYIESFCRLSSTLKQKLAINLKSSRPLRVEARELGQPVGIFHKVTRELGRGKWNQEPFYQPVPRRLRCKVVCMPPGRERNAYQVVDQLPVVAANWGVILDMDKKIVGKTLVDLTKLFADFRKEKVDLAIFVLSGNTEYPYIKRQGELYDCMVTQCIKDATLRKPNVFNNLMLKINGKLGGLNWVVGDLSRRLHDEFVMVMGADVTHPMSTGGRRDFAKSVAAVVGSISSDLMRYVAIVRQQEHKKVGDVSREEIEGMEGIFTDLLRIFADRNNGRLPTKIIFYRDGVSEGQFYKILCIELKAMQKACSELRPGYEPGFTFIVVQKRHHIRFNPTNSRDRNVKPGTVVDTEITHPREFDFYLCSQEGIQGTSKPAHYYVLYDDNNWEANSLQNFTYCLCHAYMRCCRSVSYPAPTYYSHLAAFRARDWLKGLSDPQTILQDNRFKIHPGQQESMFFL